MMAVRGISWSRIRAGCPRCGEKLQYHALSTWCTRCGWAKNWDQLAEAERRGEMMK